MKLIKCDKCGETFEALSGQTRQVYVGFGHGPVNSKGCYLWQDIETPAQLSMDVCPTCWKKFVKKMHKYFNYK